jgi:hypothetical protein
MFSNIYCKMHFWEKRLIWCESLLWTIFLSSYIALWLLVFYSFESGLSNYTKKVLKTRDSNAMENGDYVMEWQKKLCVLLVIVFSLKITNNVYQKEIFKDQFRLFVPNIKLRKTQFPEILLSIMKPDKKQSLLLKQQIGK